MERAHPETSGAVAMIPAGGDLVISITSQTSDAVIIDKNPGLGDLLRIHGWSSPSFPYCWRDPLALKDFQLVAFRKAWPRLLTAVVIWCVGLYINNVSQAWLQQNMADYYKSRWKPMMPEQGPVVLWDLGHRDIPAVLPTSYADLFAGLVPVLVTVRFAVLPGPFSMRWTLLARAFMLWGILWALRGLTIIATVLPNPDSTCVPQETYPGNIWMEAWANMPFVFWDHELTCQDVLFSGHTVALTLFTLIYIRYITWTPWLASSNTSASMSIANLFRTFALTFMFVGYYVIVTSKFHYSVDVIIGSLLTVLIFQGYHSAIRVAFLPQSHPPMLCSIYGFIRWFDKHSADAAMMEKLLQRCTA